MPKADEKNVSIHKTGPLQKFNFSPKLISSTNIVLFSTLHSTPHSQIFRNAKCILAFFPIKKITAKGFQRGPSSLTCEAISLFYVAQGIEDVADIADAALGKFAVVRPIAARRRREHYEIPHRTSRPALIRVIVLQVQK